MFTVLRSALVYIEALVLHWLDIYTVNVARSPPTTSSSNRTRHSANCCAAASGRWTEIGLFLLPPANPAGRSQLLLQPHSWVKLICADTCRCSLSVGAGVLAHFETAVQPGSCTMRSALRSASVIVAAVVALIIPATGSTSQLAPTKITLLKTTYQQLTEGGGVGTVEAQLQDAAGDVTTNFQPETGATNILVYLTFTPGAGLLHNGQQTSSPIAFSHNGVAVGIQNVRSDVARNITVGIDPVKTGVCSLPGIDCSSTVVLTYFPGVDAAPARHAVAGVRARRAEGAVVANNIWVSRSKPETSGSLAMQATLTSSPSAESETRLVLG